MPIRFNLQYQSETAAKEQESGVEVEEKKLAEQVFPADELDKEEYIWKEQPLRKGFRRPVIVHRAVLGSFERFMAILTEHTGGRWPFFISPR